MSVLVQGGLIRIALKHISPQRIALMGLVSSAICYGLWGAATEGWMMYVVVVLNLFGYMATTALQTIVSNAADEHSQGRTMGAVASLNSLTAVFAPVLGAALLGVVSHLPKGDWRIGAPFFLCAALQAVATVLAVRHFRRESSSSTSAPAGGATA
jgi:DHA1 family tetracycline resistance protein-like MFS transporter